jgi:hypothetical protein
METHELGRSGLVSTTDGMNGHFWREAAIGGLGCRAGIPICDSSSFFACSGKAEIQELERYAPRAG